MKKLLIIINVMLLSFGFLRAQDIVTKTERVSKNDSVVLRLNDYTGVIQWEKSYDNETWTAIENATFDTLLFIADTSTYFKALVTVGNCAPFVSDIAEIKVSTAPEFNSVTDVDGNTYRIVQIGDQYWMTENLKTTRYNDGTAIPNITDEEEWIRLKTPAYCWYDNDEASYKDKYGALYNVYTVETKKLCPAGWQVASDNQWKELEMFLGMSPDDVEIRGWRGTNQGNKLKAESAWDSIQGTDEYGFSGLPAGYRDDNSGKFYGIGDSITFWWSPMLEFSGNYWSRQLSYDHEDIERELKLFNKRAGYSVRCIMATPGTPLPADQAKGIELASSLNWTCADPEGKALSYDVYLDSTDAKTLVSQGQSDTSYSFEGLEHTTTYYWKVVAKDINGNETTSETWSFSTVKDYGYGSVTDVEGNTYNTINIGNQTWMAENLKTTKYNDGTDIPYASTTEEWINMDSSAAYGWYGNDAGHKDKYGALYNWYTVETGKLCPDGWHVPTDSEWADLKDYVSNDGYEDSVGTALNAVSGWNISYNVDKNGSDIYGFSALPGGSGNRGNFYNEGDAAEWWSSTTNLGHTYDPAYKWAINRTDLYRHYNQKSSVRSVRCISDSGITANQAPEVPNMHQPVDGAELSDNKTTLKWNCSDPDGDELFYKVYLSREDSMYLVSEYQKDTTFTTDTLEAGITYTWKVIAYDGNGHDTSSETWSFTPDNFIFDIDGNIYKTVSIGDQTWMARNLATTKLNDGTEITHLADNWRSTNPAYCWYNNWESNKDKYGALYNYYAVETGKLCPDGWHVPTDDDWKELEMYLGMDQSVTSTMGYRGTTQGDSLKATSGWDENGNGTDDYGFSALPGGSRDFNGSFDDNVGKFGFWWSATKNFRTSNLYYTRVLAYDTSNIARSNQYQSEGLSIRCLKDNSPPTIPELIKPANEGNNSNNRVLKWSCSDPEGESLTYDVYLDTTGATTLVRHAIQDDSLFLGDWLEPGTVYYWRVVARDEYGNETSSETWSFYIIDLTLNSITHTSLGNCEGEIDITAKNGKGNYEYNWSNGATTEDISGLCTGDYIVTVTDSLGTSLTDTFTVSQPWKVDFNGDLYVYPVDNKTNIEWGGHGKYITDGNGAESDTVGVANTAAIVSQLGEEGQAAYLCDTLTAFGHDDWYLPAYQELYAIYQNKDSIGNFASKYYWSSSEINDKKASAKYFGNDIPSIRSYYKKSSYRVRCVRRDQHMLYIILDSLTYTPNNVCNGEIYISVIGGSGNYEYTWSNGMTTEDISGLCSGEYTVTVTDDDGTEITATYSVEIPRVTYGGNLYVYPEDNGKDVEWGRNDTEITAGNGADSDSDGESNTSAIASQLGTDAPAAYICDTLTAFGFDDWYLPAINELHAINQNKESIGGFSSYRYWSSTEKDTSNSWSIYFQSDAQDSLNKGYDYGQVRCVRRDVEILNIALESISSYSTGYACDGEIDITASGGSGTYKYNWSNGDTTEDVSGLCPGDYSVTVTDTLGSEMTETFTIKELPNINFYGPLYVYPEDNEIEIEWSEEWTEITQGNGADSDLYGEENTLAIVSQLGSVAKAAYACYTLTAHGYDDWYLPSKAELDAIYQNKDEIGGFSSSDSWRAYWSSTEKDKSSAWVQYFFTTGGQGDESKRSSNHLVRCVRRDYMSIELTSSSVTHASAANCDGAIQITVEGGVGDYTYDWSNGETTKDISGLCVGSYSVTITDTDGSQIESSFTVLPKIDVNGTSLCIYPEENNATQIEWGEENTDIVHGNGANSNTDGEANTAAIVSQSGSAGKAAYRCDTLTAYGYDDWYLPSKDELNAMVQNKASISGFGSSSYWSSTESEANKAWVHRHDGVQIEFFKDARPDVRCIRKE